MLTTRQWTPTHSCWKEDSCRGISDIYYGAWSLIASVGLQDRASVQCDNLVNGEQRLLEIAVTLAGQSKVLLFDEPLAGLAERDRRIVMELIVRLSKGHAVFLVE